MIFYSVSIDFNLIFRIKGEDTTQVTEDDHKYRKNLRKRPSKPADDNTDENNYNYGDYEGAENETPTPENN